MYRLGIAAIWLYRVTFGALFPTTCKYHPSCSQYAARRAAGERPRPGERARRLARCCAATPGATAASIRRRERTRPTDEQPDHAASSSSPRPLTPLEHAARHSLNWLHFSVGFTWAWSIVALTVIVRMLLVPLTVKQIHSMQNLQRYAPQMKEIQKKYKQDKQKQNEELMKFYRENQINPAASCLPMLVQLPVFIAPLLRAAHFAKEPAALHPGSLSWLHFIPSIADHDDVALGRLRAARRLRRRARWPRRSSWRRRSTRCSGGCSWSCR